MAIFLQTFLFLVKNKKQTAVIRADKMLPYGEVIEVMGLLQKAGILDISVAVK